MKQAQKQRLPVFKDFIKNALYKEDFGEFNVPNGIYLKDPS